MPALHPTDHNRAAKDASISVSMCVCVRRLIGESGHYLSPFASKLCPFSLSFSRGANQSVSHWPAEVVMWCGWQSLSSLASLLNNIGGHQAREHGKLANPTLRMEAGRDKLWLRLIIKRPYVTWLGEEEKAQFRPYHYQRVIEWFQWNGNDLDAFIYLLAIK